MHLVMFDIDGTLVDSAGFDAELYAQAVEGALGVPVSRDWDRYDNVTDSGILAQMLREPRYDAHRAELAVRVRIAFVGLVRAYLAERASAVREIAGASRLVARLAATPGVRVAVATGGWEETARLKLRHVGIETDALAFASSSDAAKRTEIMRLAERRALGDGKAARITYFGDGPWDARASAALGYDFIAVGRGVSHRVAYDDLSDAEAILARLAIDGEVHA
jgi:phosphoglycolate phosphatase-like HAD superfamily hydrolase